MQNGDLTLKKHKLTILSLFSILLFTVVCFGCKTLPEQTTVKAIDLLDGNSAFYMSIPSKVDPELINRFLRNNINNLSENNSKLISERISNVYCGLNRNKTEFQVSMEANIGNSIASKVLTQKNGWQKKSFTTEFNNIYDVYGTSNNDHTVDFAFPADYLVLAGRDVSGMLNTYDNLKQQVSNETEKNISKIDELIYNYLAAAEDEIRFYAAKPQSFLSLLTGTNLNLRLEYVSGSFICDPKFPKQYVLSLDFKFKNETFLKAGKGLLSLAFGLTNSDSKIIDDNELLISGILISKEQLYKLLIL